MDLCGNVFVSTDLSTFSLKCTKCEEIQTEWTQFVEHIRACILPDVTDEPYIDYLGVFEPDAIKQEEEFISCPLEAQIDDLEKINANDDPTKCVKPENEFGSNKSEAAEEIQDDDNSFDDDFSSESSSDESYTNGKKAVRKVGVKFTPSFYRHNKCTSSFIDYYKNQPCLWDEKNANFNDEIAQKAAYKAMIKSIKKDFGVALREITIKTLINRIRQQYYTTQENIKSGLKSKIKSLVLEYYEQCSFLGEIDEKKDDELKVVDASLKNKCLVFSNFSNEAVEALIDLYAENAVLHDANHPEYSSNIKRGVALTAIAEALKRDHNIQLTAERLSTLIRGLRDWYYKRCESKEKGETLSQKELHYLERCSFFPPKVKKIRFICKQCGISAASEATLQVHMVDVHKIGKFPHKCEECNRFFRQRSSLILHNQRSHSDKKLECEYCHRKFSVVADYRLHVRTHTEEKPYICELCGKAFRIRTQLGYHMNAIHTKLRAFKCNICPKDFLKAVHLRDHIKSHLNIRDKICETCGKGFTNCHSLIRHRQIHSAVKKFECKLCDAKFHQFVGLNSHMKRTHNIVRNKPKA